MTPGHAVASGGVLLRTAGLRLSPMMRDRVARVLDELAATFGVTVADLEGWLAQGDRELLHEILDRVTVQESSFFRDPEQLAAFVGETLPRLTRPVRVWSAGCANGQEPYTLAMALIEAGHLDARVVATDISRAAVARTRLGAYTDRELESLGSERRDRFTQPAGAGWRSMSEQLRAMVEVEVHNLVSPSPPAALTEFDVVFCRNVLMYLDEAESVAFMRRLRDWVRPGGALFVGYAESLWRLDAPWKLVKQGRSFAYRPGGDDPAWRAASPAWGSSGTVARRPVGDPTFLLADGEARASAGDLPGAIDLFQAATVAAPHDPATHLRLAEALEAAGRHGAALVSYRAARNCLDRGGSAVDAALEGYCPAALAAFLDAKLATPGASR